MQFSEILKCTLQKSSAFYSRIWSITTMQYCHRHLRKSSANAVRCFLKSWTTSELGVASQNTAAVKRCSTAVAWRPTESSAPISASSSCIWLQYVHLLLCFAFFAVYLTAFTLLWLISGIDLVCYGMDWEYHRLMPLNIWVGATMQLCNS